MKIITLALALLLCTTLVYSQKQTAAKTTTTAGKKPDVLTLFKSVVAKVDATFKKTPVVLASANFTSSPSGHIYYQLQFEEIESSYDVQPATSLVTPYTGYILLKVRVKSNKNAGDVKGFDSNVGFSDSAAAKANGLLESCDGTMDVNQWCTGDIKINYAYQEDKWVFKNIETETEKRIQMGVIRGDIEKGVMDNFFK